MTTQVCLSDKNWYLNGGVRSCTPEERVVWLEILMLMSKAESRGVLTKPLEKIAVMAGTQVQVLCALVENGLLKGRDGPPEFPVDGGSPSIPFVYRPRHAGKLGPAVTLIAEAEGPTWYCDWMVLESYRSERASCGVKAAMESRGVQVPPAVAPKSQASVAAADARTSTEPDEAAEGHASSVPEDDDAADGAERGQRVPNCPQARLIGMYQRMFPAAQQVVMVGPGNQLSKALKARWRSLAVGAETAFTGYRSTEEGLKKWEAIFNLVGRSRFLMGMVPARTGEAPFELSLVWLLGPKNMEKVLNGFYNRTADERSEIHPAGAAVSPAVSGMEHRVMSGVQQVIALQQRRQGGYAVREAMMQETLPL